MNRDVLKQVMDRLNCSEQLIYSLLGFIPPANRLVPLDVAKTAVLNRKLAALHSVLGSLCQTIPSAVMIRIITTPGYRLGGGIYTDVISGIHSDYSPDYLILIAKTIFKDWYE